MNKRIRSADGDDETRQWHTIYCSLMLVLVVFFVMLIAYSTIDIDRMQRLKIIDKAPAAATTPGMNEAMRSLQQLIDASGINRELSLERTADGFKAVISSTVLFSSGSATLNETVHAILDGIIEIAKRNDLAVEVGGHTDNTPIATKIFPSNWELSTMRAVNILKYMQQHGAIPSNRLIAVGFAEYRPVADNTTSDGRAKNRRVEIVFRAPT